MKVSRIAGAGMPDEILDRDSAFLEHWTQALKLVDFVSKDSDNRLVILENPGRNKKGTLPVLS
ncbi:MAG TPA: hypothetical protein VKF17_19655 [Isosphaeraceae bacterium]|nr:hypothetical protein [Isosphaeraceae bacterium]